jgi:hypothetical protein
MRGQRIEFMSIIIIIGNTTVFPIALKSTVRNLLHVTFCDFFFFDIFLIFRKKNNL